MDERICTKCREAKPLSEYHRRGAGHKPQCKECAAKQRREWYLANREAILQRSRDYYANNIEERREYSRAHYLEIKEDRAEYRRAWYASNPDYNRAYYEANREVAAEKSAARRESNREAKRSADRAYYEANREKFYANLRKRRARKASVLSIPYTTDEVIVRSCGICGLCGRPVDLSLSWPDPLSRSIDHILPISAGGPDHLGNVQLAHLACNIAKGNRT